MAFRRMAWAAVFLGGLAGGIAIAQLSLAAPDDDAAPAATTVVATPEPPDPGPIVRQAREGDLDLTMVVYPGYAGRNDLNFYMIDTDRDWKEVQSFSVLFTHEASGAHLSFELPQLHEGHFLLDPLELPETGPWTVAVSVVRAEEGELRFHYRFVLGRR